MGVLTSKWEGKNRGFHWGMLIESVFILFFRNWASGLTSIIVMNLFLFGINFFFLGMIGEYIGRTFLEAKQRPKYIVKKII